MQMAVAMTEKEAKREKNEEKRGKTVVAYRQGGNWPKVSSPAFCFSWTQVFPAPLIHT